MAVKVDRRSEALLWRSLQGVQRRVYAAIDRGVLGRVYVALDKGVMGRSRGGKS